MPKAQRAHGRNVWVVKRGGRYTITEEGGTKYALPPLPQRDVIAIGRIIARANRSELIVQGESGRIRARDSHGFDPRRSKG